MVSILDKPEKITLIFVISTESAERITVVASQSDLLIVPDSRYRFSFEPWNSRLSTSKIRDYHLLTHLISPYRRLRKARWICWTIVISRIPTFRSRFLSRHKLIYPWVLTFIRIFQRFDDQNIFISTESRRKAHYRHTPGKERTAGIFAFEFNGASADKTIPLSRINLKVFSKMVQNK